MITKDSREWLLIRANTGYWFSKDNMAFFGCKVYWNTLTEIEDGYLFISSEDNFNLTGKPFSIRKVNRDYGIETLEWQTLPDLKTAKAKLRELVANSHTCLMESKGDGLAVCRCGRSIQVSGIQVRAVTTGTPNQKEDN